MSHDINEGVAPRNMSDFTKTQSIKGNSSTSTKEVEQIAFFKLIMTLSNFHSTVSDMYLSKGLDARAKYHLDISLRMRNEATAIKNS